ncbi:ABC transporter ATP-binding protein [Pontibacillus halophilus JSM 076056 = DSM 19796]|uniref:ABC transporter ATP-binding protein n=1 Tax=Pontibacillus halophilus JSM 076056 = DSM 19796 TaxID=1385510 RepID=A0A0A5GMC2_9BACI|nr:ABC transporter ATP-binding protein [Pontibacillus halophilus]KGX92315.1 ABC transporter ATP-binding protein [Pontibacillus halophilus JSM 076056 = DSM 19796]
MIDVHHLSHSYFVGKKGSQQEVPVLKDVSFSVEEGEIVAIVGRSGSGKSTLLNLLSGYIRPTSGQIEFRGQDVTNYNESQWAALRLEQVGFIFQSFQLIPSMTAYENIELPLVMKGVAEKERPQRVKEMLEKVGLSAYADHYPSELSGGQQQRVSFARALILHPPILFADEPTGSLDQETERELLSFIQHLNEEGMTFVMITHDEEVAAIADRTILLDGGKVHNGEGVAR